MYNWVQDKGLKAHILQVKEAMILPKRQSRQQDASFQQPVTMLLDDIENYL